MDKALPIKPRRNAERPEQLYRVVLQQSRTDALLDVGAIAYLEDHRIDPPLLEQQREC